MLKLVKATLSRAFCKDTFFAFWFTLQGYESPIALTGIGKSSQLEPSFLSAFLEWKPSASFSSQLKKEQQKKDTIFSILFCMICILHWCRMDTSASALYIF